MIECGLEHFTRFGSAVKTQQRLGLERSRSYVVWKARASWSGRTLLATPPAHLKPWPPPPPEQQRLRGVAESTLGVALVKPSQQHAARTYRPHPLHHPP